MHPPNNPEEKVTCFPQHTALRRIALAPKHSSAPRSSLSQLSGGCSISTSVHLELAASATASKEPLATQEKAPKTTESLRIREREAELTPGSAPAQGLALAGPPVPRSISQQHSTSCIAVVLQGAEHTHAGIQPPAAAAGMMPPAPRGQFPGAQELCRSRAVHQNPHTPGW